MRRKRGGRNYKCQSVEEANGEPDIFSELGISMEELEQASAPSEPENRPSRRVSNLPVCDRTYDIPEWLDPDRAPLGKRPDSPHSVLELLDIGDGVWFTHGGPQLYYGILESVTGAAPDERITVVREDDVLVTIGVSHFVGAGSRDLALSPWRLS